MGFKANNVVVGENNKSEFNSNRKVDVSPEVKQQRLESIEAPEKPGVDVELTEVELKFILLSIKHGTFKGGDVGSIYNLVLKLQKAYEEINVE